jgi:GT2 family glycosyltransferase
VKPSQVSVIIVNYNAGPLLEKCVASVLASDFAAIGPVVVSDNASSDGSLRAVVAIAKTDQRAQIVENGANLGFAAGNNRALPFVTGDYVLFLNPDCAVEPETIARMADVMARNPQAGMAGCLVLNPDGSEQRGCRRRMPTPLTALARVLQFDRVFPGRGYGFDLTGTPLPPEPVEVEAISGAFMFVRRSALDAVGPLDEGYFMHAEDLDWCMRFRQRGWKILFVPGAKATHVQGASSRGAPVRIEYYKHQGMLRFYRKFYRDRYPRPLFWLITLAVWLRFAAKAAWLKIAG